jgi:hypothetical protein
VTPTKNLKMNLIYVVSHKLITHDIPAPCTPIYVGKAGKESHGVNDRSGISISEKNPFYSELTAHYWVWKNVLPCASDEDFIGFCHYRRFFTFDIQVKKISDLNGVEAFLFIEKNLKTPDDVILANPIKFPVKQHWFSYSQKLRRLKYPWQDLSLMEQYEKEHDKEDLLIAVNLLPEKIKSEFLLFLKESKSFSPFNMYISRPHILDGYFNILFPWLDRVEKNIEFKKRSSYQARLPGFLAERFSSFYFSKYCNPIYTNVSFIDETR